MTRRVVQLVGLHKGVDERAAPPAERLGGYVDDLLEHPYSLGAAQLKAWCDAQPELKERYDLRLVDLVDRSGDRVPGGSGEEAALGEEHLDLLLREDPVAVCFSAYCWNMDSVLWACRRLAERAPAVVTVVGGRATQDPAALLATDPAPDHVIVGEAEVPLATLLSSGLYADLPIPGIWRRRDGTVLPPPGPAEVVEELDRMPSPHLAGLVRPSTRGMMLELARGCPNSCAYCAWSSCKTRRRHGAARIEEELRWAVQAGVRHVTIVDAAIGYEPDQISELVAAARRADPGGRLSFTYNLRHELVTDAEAALLGQLPAFQVLLGMETTSEGAMARSARTALDPVRFAEALDRIATIAPPVVGVVLGLPGDDLAGFVRTMELLGRLASTGAKPRVGAVLVSLLQVFPGTALAAARDKLGLQVRERGVPYLVEHPTFSREDLLKAVLYLQWFRVRYPLVVKGPEGLGTIAPDPERLGGRLLAPLVRPSRPGDAIAGWTLRGARALFDGQGFGALRFHHAELDVELTVRLERRDESRPCYGRTGAFNVCAAGRPPARVAPHVPPLLDAVLERVAENERRCPRG